MASQSSETYRTLDLALRVGELLLSSGAGAADVSAQMGNVARACGLRRVTADVTFTELAMSHQAAADEPALIQLRQVRYRQVDFGDLTLVDHLVRDLVAGRIDRDAAAAALNRIVSSGHARPRWTVTLSLGVMGAGIGLLLSGDWTVALIAFVGACGIDVTQAQMTEAALADVLPTGRGRPRRDPAGRGGVGLADRPVTESCHHREHRVAARRGQLPRSDPGCIDGFSVDLGGRACSRPRSRPPVRSPA